MIKKIALSLIAIAIFCLLFLEYTNPEYKEKNINEIINFKSSEITKIVFSDGRGFNKPCTIEDKQKINEFMSLIDSYVIKKERIHQHSVGWIHMADFYIADKKLTSIIFTNPLNIDGLYYKITEGTLTHEIIDKFINSVNPAWNIQ
jgi:hypothetical protein